MDFLDPKKQKAHSVRLLIGYALIGAALVMATTILLYQAYGYGVDRNGRVFQNGLLFMSSRPSGAAIYSNGERQKSDTNSRLAFPAGQYVFELKRDGYRDWKRAITVEGGSVQRFDYPLLFPKELKTSITKQYSAQPGALMQSPDRRWLMVQSTSPNIFDIYDLNTDNPTAQQITVPTDSMSAGTITLGWEQLEWANNNRHVLLRRTYDRAGSSGQEYILFDREEPEESTNLSVLLGFTPSDIALRDKKFDQYYAFDQNNGTLFSASIEEPTPQPLLEDVLAFESEGPDTLLYVTSKDAPKGKSLVEGDDDYLLRQVASGSPYLLELGRYEGNWLVVAGVASEDRVYVYKNPLDTLRSGERKAAAPVYILKTPAPGYLSFSVNGRFAMIENGDSFAVYDAETDKGYAYALQIPVDAPLGRATWMDGHRLQLVSNGQLVVFDFDGTNRQTLMSLHPGFTPYYNRDYGFAYTISPAFALSSTSLRIPEDQ